MLRKHKRKQRKKLIKQNNHDLDFIINSEIKKSVLRTKFPKEIENNLYLLKEKESNSHIDLTHIPFVTIDGKESRDFDDAVYANNTDNYTEIMVAVADVSYYVKENDTIDIEAKKRGNSFYLPNKVIPMLPELLSNELCSLIPNKNRLCIIVKVKVNKKGKIISSSIIRGKIRSVARLTYDEVEDYLEKKKKIMLKF